MCPFCSVVFLSLILCLRTFLLAIIVFFCLLFSLYLDLAQPHWLIVLCCVDPMGQELPGAYRCVDGWQGHVKDQYIHRYTP